MKNKQPKLTKKMDPNGTHTEGDKLDAALQYLKDRNLDNVYNDVRAGKFPKKRFKIGECYANSATIALMWELGYKYVEGVVTRKSDDVTFSHAWNLDPDGNHVDFTPLNVDEYLYRGAVIDIKDVIKVQRDYCGGLFTPVIYFLSELEK